MRVPVVCLLKLNVPERETKFATLIVAVPWISMTSVAPSPEKSSVTAPADVGTWVGTPTRLGGSRPCLILTSRLFPPRVRSGTPLSVTVPAAAMRA